MPEENAGEHEEEQEGAGSGNGEGDGGSEGAGEQTPEQIAAAEAAQAEEAERLARENAEPEVHSRKSAKDYIIERQQRKIEKLKNSSQGKDDEEKEDEENSGNDEDDEVNPEDENLITKVVLKKFAPIIEKQLAGEDEVELKDFIEKNPDFKAYESQARKFMQHPSRRMLPIKSIFYEVAGDDLIKIGAKRQKDADELARRDNAGGGSARGTEGAKPDYATMSDEEFAKEREAVRQKGRQ